MRRARHGRPPSRWLRSLHSDELRVWLKTIEVPEAGVEGMTFWEHLTRDHSFNRAASPDWQSPTRPSCTPPRTPAIESRASTVCRSTRMSLACSCTGKRAATCRGRLGILARRRYNGDADGGGDGGGPRSNFLSSAAGILARSEDLALRHDPMVRTRGGQGYLVALAMTALVVLVRRSFFDALVGPPVPLCAIHGAGGGGRLAGRTAPDCWRSAWDWPSIPFYTSRDGDAIVERLDAVRWCCSSWWARA